MDGVVYPGMVQGRPSLSGHPGRDRRANRYVVMDREKDCGPEKCSCGNCWRICVSDCALWCDGMVVTYACAM